MQTKQTRFLKDSTSHSTNTVTLGVLVWLLLNLLLVREANAQGTILFNNYVPSKVQAVIYGPPAGSIVTSQLGNGATGYPPGTTSWAGWTLVGATGGTMPVGSTTLAALLGAQGTGQAESSLQPASSSGITSFRSGAGAGVLYATTPTFNNISKDAAGATVEMVAWDNSSGLYSTWALAKPAWMNGLLLPVGTSGTFNVLNIGGDINTPPNLLGLRSFNLYWIPEPAMLELLGLGTGMLLIAWRRRLSLRSRV